MLIRQNFGWMPTGGLTVLKKTFSTQFKTSYKQIKRTYGKRLFGYLKPASRFDNKRGKLYPV